MTELMVPRVQEPEWRRRAACSAPDDLDDFFPRGRPPRRLQDMCAECPVRRECREAALESPWPPFGVWGGETSTELMPEWKARRAG